jgi:hypothetical protein
MAGGKEGFGTRKTLAFRQREDETFSIAGKPQNETPGRNVALQGNGKAATV